MEGNWGGNHTYRADKLHRPTTVAELQEIVVASERIRVLGSRHSFNAIADADELVSLEGLPRTCDVDAQASTATVSAAMSYADVAAVLHAEGLALHNLASLPHLGVAGAISTATHGSGDRSGNLATAVRAFEFVRSDGELVVLGRGAADFDGAVVGLGAVGAITCVVLDVEPAYDVCQHVFLDLDPDVLVRRFDDITAAGDSVSIFTTWERSPHQVWVKRRTAEPIGDLFGARRATEDVHPIPGFDPSACTPQMGRLGPWHERIPHFRAGAVPSAGREQHTEFFVDRRYAPEAIEALQAIGPSFRHVLHVSEIRTVAADSLWMSPQYERDCAAIHFTWRLEDGVAGAVERIETALEPFDARPHWGKLFASHAGKRYPRASEFARLIDRLDPRRAFTNDWLETYVL